MADKPIEEVNKSVTASERIAQLEEELAREKASHAEDVRSLKQHNSRDAPKKSATRKPPERRFKKRS